LEDLSGKTDPKLDTSEAFLSSAREPERKMEK